MKTEFDLGETVFVKGKITKIVIEDEGHPIYKLKICSSAESGCINIFFDEKDIRRSV